MSETIIFPEGFGDCIGWGYDENHVEPTPEAKAIAYSEGLAAFAAWVKEHPEFVTEFLLPRFGDDSTMSREASIPSSVYSSGDWIDGVWHPGKYIDRTPAEMAAEMLRVRRLAGLKHKFAQNYSVGFFQDFASVPGLVRLIISMPREVTCEMVDTGEVETYTERKIVTPAVIEEVESTKPIMRRVCVDSLAALAHEEATAES